MASYEANIRIGVQGQQELDRALSKIERLNQAIGEASSSGRTIQSLQAYNTVLKETAAALRFVEIGTNAETAAVRQYVTALGQANAARGRQNALIAEQTRTQRLAAGGIRETPNQYARPAGPAGNAADAAAGTFRAGTAKVTEATKTAEQAGDRLYALELKRIEDAATAGIAADNELFQKRVASEEAYWQRRLKLAAQARQVEARDATRAGFDTSGRGRRRELDRTGGLSFDDRLAQVQERRQARQASRGGFFGGSRKSAIEGAAIGGGFPLLFGQGAGASVGGLLGGGLGGALTGSGGFAGGIVGSLLGTQFDKLKASALGLAEALNKPAEALAALKAVGVTLDTTGALENTVAALENLGRGAEAQALVFAKLEQLGGTDYVQNLLKLREANEQLQVQWTDLSITVQEQLLPVLIELTKQFADLAASPGVKKLLEIIGFTLGVGTSVPRAGLAGAAAAARGEGLGGVLDAAGNEIARPFGQARQEPSSNLSPPPISDAAQRKALDEAIARQKEVLDLQRRGEDLARAGIDFRRDQEEQIFNLRKKAADYDREVTKFRRDIEEKIFDKQQENARTLAELTRQRRQNVIEQLDQTLEPAGQISALQGGGRAASVDLAREYIRTVAEGQADLQQKETESKLNIAKVQRDADKFSLDVADKVKDFSDKAADYAREVEKFKYETAKKVVDLQRQAADYTYAQWERVYKLAATAAEKSALAADQGVSEPASNFASNASRGKALIGIGKRLGISPLDLALVIQAESGGNPGIVGGAGGNYQGLIQFGPSERKQYGYRRGMGFEEQLGPGGPVENYLKDRFRGAGRSTQGASLLDLYTTVLAGNPGANPDSRDSFGNSARSQVAKIQREREGVRRRYFSANGPLSVEPSAAAAPVSFPSAASVAGPAPKAPSALPLTGVPSSLARPDVSRLVGQYKDLNAESVRYLQDLQQTAREAAKLSEIAAKTKLDRGNAALSQQFLQPLLDANQALEDRAAYEREYGDLLQNGALPALAEQLATADQLEKTQLRLLELEQSATQEAIRQTEAQLARTDITIEQRKEQEKILAILQGQAAVLDSTRGTVIQQSDQQRSQIQAAESPEARRQRTLNEYNTRKNNREDKNRPFDQYMKAKADLEDLVDPLNQVMSAADALGSAFGDAFTSIISGSESADQALKKMFANIGNYFLDMAMQILAQQAMTSILGMISGGVGAAAGGGGGPVGGFLSGGLFNNTFSYAGGGYTGDGSRSGGIDGQGGFAAILHPQETVIDHTTSTPLRPSGQMMSGDTATPEISYGGPVLVFNSTEYVMKKDVPKIIAAGTAATGNKMRNSVAFRKRAGI